ncbi:MAG: vWA domain-containing protein [Ktedonobacteraceae bacterium]
MQGFMSEGYVRRLPVYLLLDCSGSMQGDAIIAVNEGLEIIYRLLIADPRAIDTVFISVICFADQATQYELTSLDQFQPPILSAQGQTALGGALQLLMQSIQHDLIMNTPTQHGDYRPLVFLLTDGEPTDRYQDGIQQLQMLQGSQKPTIVALGCGSQVNERVLRSLTPNVSLMHAVSTEAIKTFFRWMSGSIAQTAHAGGPLDTTVYTPPPGVFRLPRQE